MLSLVFILHLCFMLLMCLISHAEDGVSSTLSRFACNTRMIVDASSNSPVSHVKLL